jgi:predicted acetyltransferase
MEIRTMKKSDLGAYGDLCRYCFRDFDTLQSIDRYMSIVVEQLGHSWGAFKDGKLHAGLWYQPFEMRVGESFLPMGGVAAVVSRPESRNQGLIRELMTRMHQQMRGEKRPLAVLMPFKNSFYAAMGYADSFFVHEHLFEPHQIAHRPVGSYTIREVNGQAHWETLEHLRLRCGGNYTGTVRRDAGYWESRYFTSWKGLRNVYVVERPPEGRRRPGSVVGFLITNLSQSIERADARVAQAVWADPGALNAIMQFLRNLRDQVKEVRWFLPVDVDIFPHFEDPKIKVLLWPKMMLKLVDLKGAIEGRHYNPDCSGEVILDVLADATSPWNGGKWRVNWNQGAATVHKVRRLTTKTPAIKTDIQTLAVIYSGHRSVSALARQGSLKASSSTQALLDGAFPPGAPCMEEWF